jgi:integrating conjugative element protein (TIGR03765 family)
MTENPIEKASPHQTTSAGRRAAADAAPYLALCAALSSVSMGSAAQGAAVIHDQGPTRPLSDYVEAVPSLSVSPSTLPLRQASPQAQNHAPHDAQNLQAANPQGLPNLPAPNLVIPVPAYPVDTPSLAPGPVNQRRIQMPQLAAAPFFLVGNDPLSRDWLARFGGRLAAMGAVGFLVKAESDADLQSLRRLAPGIPITPLDATPLAKTLGLSHYPVLVTAGLIEQ